MSVVIESKRTRGIGGPFAVVVNARHGRVVRRAPSRPFQSEPSGALRKSDAAAFKSSMEGITQGAA